MLIVYAAGNSQRPLYASPVFLPFFYEKFWVSFLCQKPNVSSCQTCGLKSVFPLDIIIGRVLNLSSCLMTHSHQCLQVLCAIYFTSQHLLFPPSPSSGLRYRLCVFLFQLSLQLGLFHSFFSTLLQRNVSICHNNNNKKCFFTVRMCTRRWHLVIWIVQLYFCEFYFSFN